jgi:hypothetical protein
MSNNRPKRSIHVSLPVELGAVGVGGGELGVLDGDAAGVGLGGAFSSALLGGDGGTVDGGFGLGCDSPTLSSTITISIFSDTISP